MYAKLTRSVFICVFFVCLFVPAATAQVDLFEKQVLSEWDFHADKEGIAVADVFSFTDKGILQCKGEPFGYLATKELYKNFKLSVDYRWPKGVTPTNSGIFLRLTEQPAKTFLPKCFEVQLAHKSAGDLWGFHGQMLPPPPPGTPETRFVNKDGGELFGRQTGVKKVLDAEKEPGLWNKVDILCSEGLLVVVLNGKIVNWATTADVAPGKIGFQSEGGPIEFRNAVLTPLP